jgi:hypothetical protein
MDFGQLGQLQNLVIKLTEIANVLFPFAHPTLIVKTLLDDSLGLLLKVWFGFILHTTDFETGGDFTSNATIQAFEPKVQLLANGALVIVAIWASYRIMWGHGLRSQYTARILLPRLLLSVVLINFALPMLQAVVQASNAACDAIQSFGTIPDWSNWLHNLTLDPSAGILQIVATAGLVLGYDLLGIAYLIRYTILIVLAHATDAAVRARDRVRAREGRLHAGPPSFRPRRAVGGVQSTGGDGRRREGGA